MFNSKSRRALMVTSTAIALTIALAGQAAAAEAADTTVDEVVVTGTRETGRTQFTTLSPVDVLSEKAIHASVSSQVG
ncbi:MAG TPA: hypothetical protein PLV04_02870, partial [Phenylobacterium sp.]|nr:hypothetical protein [Phenylobacterium sp.]